VECNRCGERMELFKIGILDNSDHVELPVCIYPGCSLFGVLQAPRDMIRQSPVYIEKRDKVYKERMKNV
jgi:hypothetical protein